MKKRIDLKGPEGNAFNLIGLAINFAKQLGFSKEETEKIKRDMYSSDYTNLVKVFKENFGNLVDIIEDDEL